ARGDAALKEGGRARGWPPRLRPRKATPPPRGGPDSLRPPGRRGPGGKRLRAGDDGSENRPDRTGADRGGAAFGDHQGRKGVDFFFAQGPPADRDANR